MAKLRAELDAVRNARKAKQAELEDAQRRFRGRLKEGMSSSADEITTGDESYLEDVKRNLLDRYEYVHDEEFEQQQA